MDLLVEAAKAVEGYTSDIATKLSQKEEKHPPAAAAAAVAAADDKTDDDADVTDAAPFVSKPFLESAVFFGHTARLSPAMQIRARDVPSIEHYLRLTFIRAFTAWVVYRRMQNDRATNRQRSFGEFKSFLHRIVSIEPLFAGTPAKFSYVLDYIDSVFNLLKIHAGEAQRLQPPASPSVPAITTMQQSLLEAGIDTTFETTEIDVTLDDILCADVCRPGFKPMAIYTGTPGGAGVLERIARDSARRKRAIARDENDRPAKRHAPG